MGGGSAGAGGGTGGSAISTLTINDVATKVHLASVVLEGDVFATGGAGGAGNGTVGSSGGAATASSTISGDKAVTAKATATGGDAGLTDAT